MTEEFVRVSILCCSYCDRPVKILGRVLKIDIITSTTLVIWGHIAFAINSHGYTNFESYGQLTSWNWGIALQSFPTCLIQSYIINCIVTKCKLDTYYQNGTIIRKLDALKCFRIVTFAFEIIFHVGLKMYSFFSYFVNKEEIVSIYRGSDLLFWTCFFIGCFQVFCFIWLLLFTKTIDSCLLSLKHSTLYVGENYQIDESISKEAEKSKEGENKLEILDHFEPEKFEKSEIPSISVQPEILEESKMPSISCSKSENTEQDDDFAPYCQDPNNLNEILPDKHMNIYSIELDWIPKDETIEENDYQPYSKKQPYSFPNFKHSDNQNPKKDNQIHQEKEAIQFDQRNEVIGEVMNEVQSEVMRSQKSESRENEVHIQEVMQEIHIKETKDIKILIHRRNMPNKMPEPNSNKSKERKNKKSIIKSSFYTG